MGINVQIQAGTTREQREAQDAWRHFSKDGVLCRYCPHGFNDHEIKYSATYFFAPATLDDKIWQPHRLHKTSTGRTVKQFVVNDLTEITGAACKQCAKDNKTHQSVCYFEKFGIGEVIG